MCRRSGPARVAWLAWLALWPLWSSAATWDVEGMARPAVDAEFTVSEGTWMSVDVSPDGRTLVFDLLGGIYAMPATGGEARLLHGGPAMQRDPRYSADGRRLLYISDRDGSENAWISNVDGTGAHAATHESVNTLTGPAWGPGDSIAAARLFGSADKLHAAEIVLYDTRGGAGRVVVPAPANGESVHEPQFSRDGRELYYTEKVSPPSTSYVYIDANNPNFAIKRRDLETGATEELIRGWGGATTPRPSPDGRRIAFVRRVKQQTVLFVYDVATREQRAVFDGLDRDAQADFIWQGTYYPQYGWFPDNRHVAIWGKGKLWNVDVDVDAATAVEIPFRVHARHRIVVPPRFRHELAPPTVTVHAIRQLAWSPRDGSVVFNALGRLWRMRAGQRPVRLTRAPAFEFEPAYSPDGRTIAYVEWDDERGARLLVVDAAGGTPRTVVASSGVLRAPAFSRDGTRLAYVIEAGDRCLGGSEARAGVYWLDLRSGESHYVTEPVEAPIFAPDGKRLYFSTSTYTDHALVTSLVSVNLDGLDRRVHATTRDADSFELRPSPDLQWIAFRNQQQYYVVRYRETGASLVLDPADPSLHARQLTQAGGYALAWSHDSARVHWALGPDLQSVAVADTMRSAPPRTEVERVQLEVPADAPLGDVAFVNARVITMRGEDVIEHGTVVVRGNRIAAVGPAESVTVPHGAFVVDASGKTIMPGFIDMHGHIDLCYYTSSGLMPQKQPARYADLAFGVTTNYDPYTSELPSYTQSEMTMSGDMVGPRSIVSGSVAYGRTAKGDGVYVPIRGYADAETLMRPKVALGGWIVKSYRQPMRSQRQQLIEAGRAAGVMVDVEGESNFYHNLTMILDGNTNLQHNFPVATYYDDVLQLMARGHVSHTPTLVVTFGELMGENYIYQHMRVWDDPKLQIYVQATTSGYSPLGTPHYAPPYVRGMSTIHAAEELWDIGFRSVARSMKRLDDAGVTINAGSHGQVPGIAQHWEMWLLAQGGMSNQHVLRAATLNGARTLELDDQVGSLEPGKLADLIVLDANPLDDIHNTNTVHYTMVNGRLYDSLTMNEIGNRPRERGRFYWETGRTQNIADWKKAWAHE